MAYRSYALATEDDTDGRFDLASGYKVTITDLQQSEEDFAYFDDGAGFYSGDFTHWNHFNISAADNSGQVMLWMLTGSGGDTGIGSYQTLRDASESLLAFWVNYDSGGGILQLWLQEIESGGATNDSNVVDFNLSTDYWVEIERDEAVGTYGTLYVRIYSDIERVTLVDTLSVTLTVSKKDFRYLYGVSSRSSGGAATISGVISHLNTDPTEAKIVGVSASSTAISFTPQAALHFDGKYWNAFFHESDGSDSEAISIAYADKSDNVFGIPHDAPFVGAVTNANNFNSFYGYPQTLGMNALLVLDDNTHFDTSLCNKSDDSLSASTSFASTSDWEDGAVTNMDTYPSVAIDGASYVWNAGRDGSGGSAAVKIKRAAQTFSIGAWDSTTTLRATATSSSNPQIVVYRNKDIGCFVSDGTDLFYYHWDYSTATDSTDFDAEETAVSADLAAFPTFKGVVLREGTGDEHLFVVYKSTTNTTIKYRIRPLSSGTWGTAANVATDAIASNHQFTVVADAGNDETAYIIYHDGTNLVYRTWNGTVISGKTTLVSSVTLKSTSISASLYDSDFIGVMYHDDADDNIKIATIDITPTQVSSTGVFVAKNGAYQSATGARNTQVVSDGDKHFVTYMGRDHQAWANVYDSSTETWDFSWTVMSEKRYFDLHNTLTIDINSSGIVYLTEGGRNAGNSSSDVVIYLSDFALSHASFTLTKSADWTDISPSGLNGRGYKKLVVDGSTVHFLFLTDNQNLTIRKYTGSWGSPTTLVTMSDNDNIMYWVNAVLDTNGDIHVFYTYRDQSVQPQHELGSILHNELAYMLVDGSAYTATMDDTTAISLPADALEGDIVYSGEDTSGSNSITVWAAETVTAVGDYVFDVAKTRIFVCTANAGDAKTGATEPSWDTDHHATTDDDTNVTWQEVCIRDDDWTRLNGGVEVNGTTPYIAFNKCSNTTPFAITELLFTKGGQSTWATTQIESSGFPDRTTVEMVKGTDTYVAISKTVSGVDEIVFYVSEDSGATWEAAEAITAGSTYNNQIPLLSTRSASVQNIVWHQRIHRNYSEVMFDEIEILLEAVSNLAGDGGLAGNGSMIIGSGGLAG